MPKRCTKCGQWKLLAEFKKDKRKKDGCASWCKACHNQATYKWQKEHPEERRERERAWYAKNTEKAAEKKRAWRANNIEKAREIVRRFYYAHIEPMRERGRNWHRVNNDRSHEYAKNWKKTNPEKTMNYSRNRRAWKKESGGTIRVEEWESLKKFYNYMCLCCGRREPEIKLALDHVVPLKLGGANSIENAQPLCKTCNSRKGAKAIDYR